MLRFSLVIAGLLFLSACATAYQEKGFSGGYTELPLGNNLYKVSFDGNGYTRPQRAADFALLRAAELALENGATHFGLVDSAASVSTGVVTMPTSSYTTGTVTNYGGYSSLSANTTTTGGQTINITKPSTEKIVLLIYDITEYDGPAFAAQTVYEAIRAKYNVEPTD